MQNSSLKIKAAILTASLLAIPLVSLANFQASSTAATTSVKVAAQMAKKDEISKQLNDTITLCSALISRIQGLEDRVMERESILEAQGILSAETEKKISDKQNQLDKIIAAAEDLTNNQLLKLSDEIVNAGKPAKLVKDFRKEVNKVKLDIVNAHSLVMDIIELIKKETLRADADKVIGDEASTTMATSTEDSSN